MDSLLTAPLVAEQSTENTDSVCYTHLTNSYVYLSLIGVLWLLHELPTKPTLLPLAYYSLPSTWAVPISLYAMPGRAFPIEET